MIGKEIRLSLDFFRNIAFVQNVVCADSNLADQQHRIDHPKLFIDNSHICFGKTDLDNDSDFIANIRLIKEIC